MHYNSNNMATGKTENGMLICNVVQSLIFLCRVVYDPSVPLENNAKLWIANVWHTNFIFKAMVLEYLDACCLL